MRPVENVSWDEVQEFIAKLNAYGDGTYRLPTEAEWEYACRAGSTTEFSFGSGEGLEAKSISRSNLFSANESARENTLILCDLGG